MIAETYGTDPELAEMIIKPKLYSTGPKGPFTLGRFANASTPVKPTAQRLQDKSHVYQWD